MVQRVCALIVLIAGGVSGFVQTAQEGLKWEQPADLATSTNVRRVFLEIRLAEAEPVRGLTFEAPVKGTEKKVHIHYATVVTNADLLKARVVEISGRYEVEHLSTALGLVAAGVGSAILPYSTIQEGTYPRVRRIPLVKPVISRDLVMIRRRNATLSPAAQRFYDMLVGELARTAKRQTNSRVGQP